MIKSMTGYSRQEAETDFGRLVVELKSWNHRYCNITIRTPDRLSRFEHRSHSIIRNRVSRGQVQVSIEFIKNPSVLDQVPVLDFALAKQYHQELARLQAEFRPSEEISFSLLAQLPGVLTLHEADLDEAAVWCALQSLLETALDRLEAAKQAEGAVMLEEINRRLRGMQSLIQKVRSASVDLVESAYAKLEVRLNELLEGRIEMDASRLAMEAGVIAARSDITEELVRMDSHCAQFVEYLQTDAPVGRPLDFLLQEMNREANTISSKASLPSISLACVSLKTEIEKIRELVQNVE